MLGGIVFAVFVVFEVLIAVLAVICFRARTVLGVVGGVLLVLVAVCVGLFAWLYIAIQAAGGLRIPM